MEPCQPAELEPGQQVAEAVAAILCGPADPRLKRAGEGAGGVRDGRMGGIAPQVREYSDAGVADRDLEAFRRPLVTPVYTWAAINAPCGLVPWSTALSISSPTASKILPTAALL